MARQRWCTVWVGYRPGVYDSWEKAKIHVLGYPNARYKSFGSFEAAASALSEGWEAHWGIKRAAQSPKPEPSPVASHRNSVVIGQNKFDYANYFGEGEPEPF